MKLKEVKSKKEISKSDEEDGYLIDANEKEVRRIVASMKGLGIDKKIFVLGRDDNFNRRVLETIKIDYLVSPERGHSEDTLKQRDSGLNHVLAKIAKERGVGIVIDFDSLRKMDRIEKARAIARIIQNVKICRRAGCRLKIALFSDEYADKGALKAFLFSLGASSEQVRDACNFGDE